MLRLDRIKAKAAHILPATCLKSLDDAVSLRLILSTNAGHAGAAYEYGRPCGTLGRARHNKHHARPSLRLQRKKEAPAGT